MCLAQQAQEQLLLQLRDHLAADPALTASHQRLQTKLQQETCMGPRLALTPPVLDILKAIPPATWIISLHLSEHGSVLYCAALRGQQTSDTGAAGKTKSTKQGRTETAQVSCQTTQTGPFENSVTEVDSLCAQFASFVA